MGHDVSGQESLGVLTNKLIPSVGDGGDGDFLRELLPRYPLERQPVAARGIGGGLGEETEKGVAEVIIGANTLRDVYTLEVLLEMARAVAPASWSPLTG